MDLLYINIIQFILEVAVFMVLMVVSRIVFDKVRTSKNRIFNPHEYFPDEEIHSLQQIFYLIMMGLCFINVFYTMIFIRTELIYLVIFDIILSLYVATKLDKSTWKNRILVLLLIPFGSLTYLLFGNTLVGLLDFIHVPVFLYILKLYFDKFREYTESNGLGIAIILLYTIVFVSFLVTQFVEHVNPLDSLVMVSNAFTSNGYTVLGTSIAGKINSIILVWGGYLLSGVGTATLAAAILTRHFNAKIEEMDERFDRLEELIKNSDED